MWMNHINFPFLWHKNRGERTLVSCTKNSWFWDWSWMCRANHSANSFPTLLV